MASLCLLYTSDAADERSSVDLGGRRIIKKKKHEETQGAKRRQPNKQNKLEYEQTGDTNERQKKQQ